MLKKSFTVSSSPYRAGKRYRNSFLLSQARAIGSTRGATTAVADEYNIQVSGGPKEQLIKITGTSPSAELYGVFHLLEEIAAERDIPLSEKSAAAAPIRWSDQWDNPHGTIERGYAGPSIFFERGHVKQDLARATEYAQLLASVGINGCNVNNVNADLDTLTSEHLQEFARLASVFPPLAVNLPLTVA